MDDQAGKVRLVHACANSNRPADRRHNQNCVEDLYDLSKQTS